ncbi:MAG: hypothetical protein ABIA04_00775 [Pseudomonadota bacterium]
MSKIQLTKSLILIIISISINSCTIFTSSEENNGNTPNTSADYSISGTIDLEETIELINNNDLGTLSADNTIITRTDLYDMGIITRTDSNEDTGTDIITRSDITKAPKSTALKCSEITSDNLALIIKVHSLNSDITETLTLDESSPNAVLNSSGYFSVALDEDEEYHFVSVYLPMLDADGEYYEERIATLNDIFKLSDALSDGSSDIDLGDLNVSTADADFEYSLSNETAVSSYEKEAMIYHNLYLAENDSLSKTLLDGVASTDHIYFNYECIYGTCSEISVSLEKESYADSTMDIIANISLSTNSENNFSRLRLSIFMVIDNVLITTTTNIESIPVFETNKSTIYELTDLSSLAFSPKIKYLHPNSYFIAAKEEKPNGLFATKYILLNKYKEQQPEVITTLSIEDTESSSQNITSDDKIFLSDAIKYQTSTYFISAEATNTKHIFNLLKVGEGNISNEHTVTKGSTSFSKEIKILCQENLNYGYIVVLSSTEQTALAFPISLIQIEDGVKLEFKEPIQLASNITSLNEIDFALSKKRLYMIHGNTITVMSLENDTEMNTVGIEEISLDDSEMVNPPRLYHAKEAKVIIASYVVENNGKKILKAAILNQSNNLDIPTKIERTVEVIEVDSANTFNNIWLDSAFKVATYTVDISNGSERSVITKPLTISSGSQLYDSIGTSISLDTPIVNVTTAIPYQTEEYKVNLPIVCLIDNPNTSPDIISLIFQYAESN